MEIGRFFIQLLCLISIASSAAGDCPNGFTYLETGSCYKVVWESHDWVSAGKKCQEFSKGSNLVAITSAEENSAVKSFLATKISGNLGNTACFPNGEPEYGHMFWTSGQQLIKRNSRSPFVWRPSSDNLMAFDFTNWAVGAPRGGDPDEYCVLIEVYNDFRWTNYPCRSKTCPLCKYTA